MANWKSMGDVRRWNADASPEQVSDCWDARYQDPELNAQVTVYWYVVQRGGVYRVERQTEWLLAADLAQPGATEEWSDTVYDLDSGVYTAMPDAERAAEQLAREYDPRDVDWDGRRH